MELTIQALGVTDMIGLQQLGRETFSETFAPYNTEENIRQYLAEKFAESRLLSELSNPDSAFYLLRRDGAAVGYLKLNFGRAQTEQQTPDSMEIERIYVLACCHGTGAGQQLLDHALEIARTRRCSYVWLGVWENNQRALRFYQRNGFRVFDSHIFHMGGEDQTDYLMKREVMND